LAQFTTEVDGHEIHFIHEKSRGTTATPILLIHGWPDSFIRFLKIIPLLIAPDENGHAFDVVVPSIPGYGFSGKPDKKGMNPKRIAALFADLMTDALGYSKFIAHGGDWGSAITEQLGLYHESHLLGLHLTDVPSPHGLLPLDNPSAAEKAYLKYSKEWVEKEGAYFMEHNTKPQTLAYGLNDSPVALAAWIIEKFRTWSDNNGSPEDAVSRDELLTNLTIYWATQTALSSISIYYEANQAFMQSLTLVANLNPFNKEGSKGKVPAAFAIFPEDTRHLPREFAERFFNVTRWTKMKAGGHFTAMEEPDQLAADLRGFAAELRVNNKN
jgi:pimeloyl-ACP methyl ester carboxylesterase